MVDQMVKSALIRLNPCIDEHPAHADTVMASTLALTDTLRIRLFSSDIVAFLQPKDILHSLLCRSVGRRDQTIVIVQRLQPP